MMSQIEIRHLKLINAIEETGTLKDAAKKLFLTPSALSHQLKELESRLNVRIFYRVKNKLLFTPSGKALRDAGEEILNRLKKVEDTLQEINKDQIKNYIHGYSIEESIRLNDQADVIAETLHWDSKWEKESLILEAGCGVGAQTKIIAPMNSECNFISVDVSVASLETAKETIEQNRIGNVELLMADIFELPFPNGYFDHIFVCFVLEHLSNPDKALRELRRVLKPNGTITIIEGDHGSAYFHPDHTSARKVIEAQVLLQAKKGGNANIGRELYPLLATTGFEEIHVSPRQIYVDDSKPKLLKGFIRNTFTAMVRGISEEALEQKIIDKKEFERGIQQLHQTSEGGGTFCYTFFKAIAIKK